MSARGAPRSTPARIVSLVPSLTEACFALGLGDRVVGVTDYCVHPRDAVARIARVGGTKDADVEAIAALAPDLVIANREENTRRVVEGLEARGLRVWLTYPTTVETGAEVVRALARVSPERARAEAVVAELDAALATLAPSGSEGRAAGDAAIGGPSRMERVPPEERPRVFCPIWRDPWMAVGAGTYANDLLERCGAHNPFARASAAAGARGGDRRYPIVALEEVVAAKPDVVLLPDEPYPFGPDDAAEIAALDVPAARSGRIHSIDGTWVSWYGPRIATAVRELRRRIAIPR